MAASPPRANRRRSAFLSGANSSRRLVSTTSPALGQRQHVEDEALELQGILLSASRVALFVEIRHLLARDVKRQQTSAGRHARQEIHVEKVDGRTARPQTQPAVFVLLCATFQGRSEYSIMEQRPSTCTKLPSLSVGPSWE